MRNNKVKTKAMTSAVMADEKTKIRRLMQCWGYNDRVRSLPFRPEYETMTRTHQNNYEIGRLRAANIIAAGIKPPAWKENVFTPRGLKEAAVYARDTIGSAFPVAMGNFV